MTILEAVKELTERFDKKYWSLRVDFTDSPGCKPKIEYQLWISIPSGSINLTGYASLEALVRESTAMADRFINGSDVAMVAAEADVAVAGLNA